MYTWHSKVGTSGLALFLTLLFVPVAFGEERLSVDWHEGRLSVDAKGTSLSRLLLEVSHRTALEIEGAAVEALQDEVTITFAQLPLRDAIRRLFAPLNYVILEERSAAGESRPVRVLVLGRRPAAPGPAVAGDGPGATSGEPAEAGMVTPPGTALDDERTRDMARADFPGRPLEDERKAAAAVPEVAGGPLADELAVAAEAHPGGIPLDDERDAAFAAPHGGGRPLDDEPGAHGG